MDLLIGLVAGAVIAISIMAISAEFPANIMLNIWKPRIVEFPDDTYAVRRQVLFWYEYLDREEKIWRSFEGVNYAKYNTADECRRRLDKFENLESRYGTPID